MAVKDSKLSEIGVDMAVAIRQTALNTQLRAYLSDVKARIYSSPAAAEFHLLLSAQLIAAKKSQAYLEGNPEERNPAADPLVEPLTAREAEVLQLIAGGMSNREIAGRLGLTANTVKGYIKNIYGKLGTNRRVQVAVKARELGLLKAE